MAILEKEVLVKCGLQTDRYYENLGYVIPKYTNIKGKLCVKKGTTILVKIDDILEGSESIKVTKICDICGKYVKNVAFSNLINSRKNTDGKDRCYKCTRKFAGESKRNNVKYEKSLEYYAKANKKEYLLKEYSIKNIRSLSEISYGTHDECLWDCLKCMSDYPMPVYQKTELGLGCPYCAGRRVNITNCVKTTHKHLVKLFWDEEDATKYTYGSGTKTNFKCPDCGEKIKNKKIHDVLLKGVPCNCKDGVSYPEKYMYKLLSQLNIKFKKELNKCNFKWCDIYRYDFYIPSLNCIVETHGRQHYEESLRGRSLKEEKENDLLKYNLALRNGIVEYVIIDCRKSDSNYIRNNIINSKLSELYDLSNIDWLECHEYACKSLVKTVSELWNNCTTNTLEVGKILNLNKSTVAKYLKQGAELGWCDYNPKERKIEIAYNMSNSRKKKIIQLSIKNEYISEWESASDACRTLNLYNINAVCRGKQKTAGGFKWMFKEDYDQYIKQAN
ncbi:zinc-ribbon domain-containing protein [Bacillus xiapuensis]|uniref:Zinc-ribbon domain-containing protein n=1 Tax=Bacillus xiapuensis TaxID=2014075 RepID=A0ABU6N883_9BACI|nr:zinc-ribbon domain-containing protein [Bacillus xiapuensis]